MRLEKTGEGQRERLVKVQPVVQTRMGGTAIDSDNKLININKFLNTASRRFGAKPTSGKHRSQMLKASGSSQDYFVKMATQSIELPAFGGNGDNGAARSQLMLQGNQKQILLRKALIAQNVQRQLAATAQKKTSPFVKMQNQGNSRPFCGNNLNYFQNLELNPV
jgi:hypothetical protein